MADNSSKATRKVAIAPISFVITVTAEKINENGTFSGIKVQDVKSSNKELDNPRIACPPQGGGSMFLRVDSVKGLKVLGDASAAPKAEKKKLF